jgi:hypothetical protein
MDRAYGITCDASIRMRWVGCIELAVVRSGLDYWCVMRYASDMIHLIRGGHNEICSRVRTPE